MTGSHSVRGATVSSDTGRATGIFLAAICDTLRSNKLSVEQAVGVSSVEMALFSTYDL